MKHKTKLKSMSKRILLIAQASHEIQDKLEMIGQNTN